MAKGRTVDGEVIAILFNGAKRGNHFWCVMISEKS